MKIELLSWTKDPIQTIAKAAATCYDSEPNIKVVKQCIRSQHHSVLEHASFTFRISGISRACSHQLVRHRMASYSQQSQRYVDMRDCKWVFDFRSTDDEDEIYERVLCEIVKGYDELLTIGTKKEEARSILPNACPTTIVVTMNLRSLAHFMNERLCSRAQSEIRKMALEMKKVISNEEQLSQEDRDIILSLCVPRCEAGELHYCPEHKGCGRQPSAKEISKIIESLKRGEANGD